MPRSARRIYPKATRSPERKSRSTFGVRKSMRKQSSCRLYLIELRNNGGQRGGGERRRRGANARRGPDHLRSRGGWSKSGYIRRCNRGLGERARLRGRRAQRRRRRDRQIGRAHV